MRCCYGVGSMRLRIKPFSTNAAYNTPKNARRWPTEEYKAFQKELFIILPKNLVIPDGRLALIINIGVSNSGFDLFNAEKCFTDTLQKVYGFNDNRIFYGVMEKEVVTKGNEYIDFLITKYKK